MKTSGLRMKLKVDSRAAVAGFMKAGAAARSLFAFAKAVRLAGRSGANAGKKLRLRCDLALLCDHYDAAISYTLPRFTFRDHWNDCFECFCWWRKPRRETIPSPYTQAMISAFSGCEMPATSFFAESYGNFSDNGEEVEIDIVRGDRL